MKLIFNESGKFTFKTSSSFFPINTVRGEWQFLAKHLVLNSHVKKSTPRLVCANSKSKNLKDQIKFDIKYVDSSKFKGYIYPLSDGETKITDIIEVDGAVIFKKYIGVNSILLDGNESQFIVERLDVNFGKYNLYECIVKPDQYHYFEDTKFIFKKGALINISNGDIIYSL